MNQTTNRVFTFLGDIRFWIILFFALRLISITHPPLEMAHNWRQTLVAMVARNFLEIDNNIFYPRVDIAGEKTGITGMEFPLLNYLAYLFSLLFGYEHWYGRLINLIVSSFGLFFFYKLVLKYFEKNVAFNSTLVLLFSVWFIYSRKIMPDTFSISFVMAGIYYGSNYLDNTDRKYRFRDLFLYALLMALGVLSKLPAAYLLAVLAIFFADKKIPVNRKVVFSAASLIALVFPGIWYFYWVPYLVDHFDFWAFFMGRSFSEGIGDILNKPGLTLLRFYDTALKYVGFGFFLFGLFRAFQNKQRGMLAAFIILFFSFLIIVFKSGLTFYHHSYYIVPFVPVMALLCGYGISTIRNRVAALIILAAIGIEGILNQQDDFRIRQKDRGLLNLEADLNKISSPKDLILINSGDYPTPMYFAHRKGWVDYNANIAHPNLIQTLKEKGLKYIVILKKDPVPLDHELVFESDDYFIYKL